MAGDAGRVGTTRAGALYVAFGAVLISFAPVFVRLAPVGPTTAAVYRMAVAAAALAALAWMGRRSFRTDRRGLLLAAVAGALFAVDLVVWHRSIYYVGPGLATILANFQVFILAGYGVIVLREPVPPRLVAAVPLALVGLVLLVGVDWSLLSSGYRAGVWLGLGTALAYGSMLLVLRQSQARAGRIDPVTNLMYVCLAATVLLVPAALGGGEGLGLPDAETGVVLVAYALAAQVAGWMLISRGLPHVEAGRAGLMLLLQPTLAFVWDILFFARATDALDVLGATTALSAIYLGTVGRARSRRELPSPARRSK